MTSGTPREIHNGEIWHKSQCETKEKQLVQDIYQCLNNHNYNKIFSVSQSRSVWSRDHRQVVVSLVDDVWDCAQDRTLDTPYLFDQNTMVITDNYVNCPSQYQVYSVPRSFYGIYSYAPQDQHWSPVRDFTFAVNRLDYKRMQVLLYLDQMLGLDTGHVNFNCDIGGLEVASESARRQAFVDQAQSHAGNPQELHAMLALSQRVPVKNHDIDHDHAYTQSCLNVTVETYSSDNIISFSEKIFRCLVTPVPWIVFAGRYAVARLRALGFDVMSDLVDHGYDALMESQHKMRHFAESAQHTIANLKSQDWSWVQARARTAAEHNQALLAQMSQTWGQDQLTWLSKLSQDLQ